MPAPNRVDYQNSDLLNDRNTKKHTLINSLYTFNTQQSLKFRSTETKVNDSLKQIKQKEADLNVLNTKTINTNQQITSLRGSVQK